MTLNAAILARLRTSEAAFLKDTCTIQTEAVGTGSSGWPSETRTTVYSNLACRLISIGQSVGTQQAIGTVATVDTFRLICPYGTDLNVGQFVTVNSVEYRVVATIEVRTDSTDSQAILSRSYAP